MVKIKPWTFSPYEPPPPPPEVLHPYAPYYYHCGGTMRDPGKPWHGVWAAHWTDIPQNIGVTFRIWLETLDQAMTAARLFVALPIISRDICPFCWDLDIFRWFTGSYPRFNIYRGQNHLLTPPSILWDWLNPDPPPGYQWDGS